MGYVVGAPENDDENQTIYEIKVNRNTKYEQSEILES